MNDIDSTLVKEILKYCPETGLFTWRIRPTNTIRVGDEAGTAHNRGYKTITINKKKYLAHRLAWLYFYGSLPSKSIDHINGIRTDNRIKNLRQVTHSENLQNQRRPRKSNPYLGVTKRPDNKKWVAYITVNGLQKNLGSFENAEEAHEAYVQAKRVYHPTAPVN